MKLNDTYYAVNGKGQIFHKPWQNSRFDNLRLQYGNCFKNALEAGEAKLRIIQAFEAVKGSTWYKSDIQEMGYLPKVYSGTATWSIDPEAAWKNRLEVLQKNILKCVALNAIITALLFFLLVLYSAL